MFSNNTVFIQEMVVFNDMLCHYIISYCLLPLDENAKHLQLPLIPTIQSSSLTIMMILCDIGKQCSKVITTSLVAYTMLFGVDPDPSLATTGGPGYTFDTTTENGIVRLKACSPSSNCVSSNYLEPPNRYVSPLKIVNDRDVAFQRAIRELQKRDGDFSIAEVVSKDYYIHITKPGTAPGSLDDIELTFPSSGGIVNIRCEARVTLPPPPFCVKKNCINGNMDQRKRLEDLMYVLGLPPVDQKQMQGAKWTPIFLNSDRVPGFYDDYDYEYH